jgi:CRISPR-associated protein Cas2
MIVITLTDCPISLRGDLTKWLLEINTGVFVGRVSARVRDNLWDRVIRSIKNGRATLVYNTNNEQHMEFRLHHSENEIIDFDGLKLVMKPSPARTKSLTKRRLGFSKASKMRFARNRKNKESRGATNFKKLYPRSFTVIDIETSGLDCESNEIIEVGAIKVKENAAISEYSALIKTKNRITPFIENLTGISNSLLCKEGREFDQVLREFQEFIGGDILVGHNVSFDIGFLNYNLEKNGLLSITNCSFDTMKMYEKILCGKKASKKLVDVAIKYGITVEQKHRSISDCELIKSVYDILKGELEKED